MKQGIGTGSGIGMGKALLLEEENIEVETRRIDDAKAEWERFLSAKEAFSRRNGELHRELGEKTDDQSARILQNQQIILEDTELNKTVQDTITQHYICAEAAFDRACHMFMDIFLSMQDEVFKQRAADINDVRVRLLRILMGVGEYDISCLPKGTILITHELPPSVTAVMDTAHIAGIVTEVGGVTSHAAILSRALEIPAVLSVKEALRQIQNGDEVIVDGNYGEVFINPSARTRKIYEAKKQRHIEKTRELSRYKDRETLTADGTKVDLLANIGQPEEAGKAMEWGAEGIGLFRTEFLFMNGLTMPTEEEQFDAYKRAVLICRDKTVVFRTLDIGGDKEIPYLGLNKENNPFLGYRGIRYCLDRTDVFQTQLRALLRASAFGSVKLMIPMVTSVNEMKAFRRHVEFLMDELRKEGAAFDENIPLGIMIETPAAARIADLLAKEADFFSIGTNDLIQYTIAVDRGNEMVSYLYSPFHPAVLRSIRQIIACGKEAGIPVGMCGEAAADPQMQPLLLGFGLDEFSVAPPGVLETRRNIARWSMTEARQIEEKVMSMASGAEISEYLREKLAQKDKTEQKWGS